MWAYFAYSCATDPAASLFGEIRIGVPDTHTGMLLGEVDVLWPDTSLDQPPPPAAIPVTDVGSGDITVGTPTVDDAHFAVTAENCGTLSPGQACDVTVAATPAAQTDTGTLTIPTSSGDQTVALEATGVAGYSSVEEREEYPSAGLPNQDRAFAEPQDGVRVSGTARRVDVDVEPYFDLTFAAPEGEALFSGTSSPAPSPRTPTTTSEPTSDGNTAAATRNSLDDSRSATPPTTRPGS